jgi:two-component system phosphate regulon sensor histidine kinase PhoR
MMRPLRVLREGATRFAAGDMRQPIEAPGTRELAALTDRLNAMARQMDEKIRTITQQAAERQAVLSGMIEGVIAIDADERVIMLNAAAAQWLDVDLSKAHGRKSFEIIRNMQLQDMVARALESGQPIEEELTLRGPDRKLSIQAQVAPLGDDAAAAGGAAAGRGVVVVLHDVTRLRHLESIRQEFVANVSHELKTPIAAIKAAVETLVDETEALGVGDPTSDAGAGHAVPATEAPNGPHRFLAMIARQADRLNAIVEDLLMLARIEADEAERSLVLTRGAVAPVLRAAVETCQAHAQEKGMTIELAADATLAASINAPLLEQAVVNMLDNAIKYSPAETRIEVAARRDNGEVVLSVRDQGPGIEKVHLPRVFERFYRTDKARSRQLGGTGLGLAIVNHVALAHGGRVSVDSSQEDGPDRGSTFRIHLPAT